MAPKQVWSIKARLESADNKRDLAHFTTAIDSKLGGCNLVGLTVLDALVLGHVKDRAFATVGSSGQRAKANSEDGSST